MSPTFENRQAIFAAHQKPSASEDGDTASEVLAEFLGLVDDFDFDVKAAYVAREFYDGKCLTLMQAHNHAYVVPIVKWGT